MVNSQQRGFTLLELAIVLIIIGIILGAILKGQELINNAKAKRLLNDIRGLATLHYTFNDRYGRFPGDCDADGTIDYNSLSATPATFTAGQGGLFCYNPGGTVAPNNSPNPQWSELEKAQLVTFARAMDVARHTFNGALYAAGPAVGAATYNVIVARQVPCFAAKVVDQSIDGALNPGTGAVRVITTGAGGAGGSILNTSALWDPTYCPSEQALVDIVYFFDRRPN